MSSSLRHVSRLVAVAASVALLPAMAAGGDETRGPAFGKPESLGVPMRAVMIRSGAIGVWPGGRPVAYVTSSSKDEPINFSVLDLRTVGERARDAVQGLFVVPQSDLARPLERLRAARDLEEDDGDVVLAARLVRAVDE